jgi:hypothetical protein
MKKFIALILLLAVTVFPQTNTNSKTVKQVFDADNNLVAVNVNITFTADSLLAQATEDFTIPEYLGVNPTNYPVAFRLKAVGTYGTPAEDIYLQGLYTSGTDTVAIDTIRATAVNQTEGDTLSTLNLNGAKPPLGYKVFIRARTADIHSGTLTLTFPIPIDAQRKRKLIN